jgi:hypothetical protein
VKVIYVKEEGRRKARKQPAKWQDIIFSDGPPGVKTIWTGLQKLYTLLDYRELFDFMGQV